MAKENKHVLWIGHTWHSSQAIFVRYKKKQGMGTVELGIKSRIFRKINVSKAIKIPKFFHQFISSESSVTEQMISPKKTQ